MLRNGAFELKHINKPDRFELNKQIISIFAHYYIYMLRFVAAD